MSFIFTLIALGFVIFIHELGHLLAAKKAKVGVSEFAIGMGPKIVSFKFQETMYSLRALPFGGFIKAKGLDDLEECSLEEDFREKSVFSRATILAAGSIMNIFLGFIIFVLISLILGEQKLNPNINQVELGSPAQSVGLLSGDEIIRVNDRAVINVESDLIPVIQASNGEEIFLEFLRDGMEMSATLSAELSNAGVYVIGVSFRSIYSKVGILKAITLGTNKTYFTIAQSLKSIKLLITGKVSVNELAGPVGIVQIASSQIQKSLVAFFALMAFISIGLGIINLFPFPILDGGHLLFLAIEALRGRPLNKNVEMIINNTAALVLIGLMAFVVFNDVVSWNDRVNLMKEMSK